MKKKSFSKKLVLNKETISNLDNEKLQSIKGGKPRTYGCEISYDFGVCVSINIVCITQDQACI